MVSVLVIRKAASIHRCGGVPIKHVPVKLYLQRPWVRCGLWAQLTDDWSRNEQREEGELPQLCLITQSPPPLWSWGVLADSVIIIMSVTGESVLFCLMRGVWGERRDIKRS